MNRNDFMRQLEMMLSDVTPNERAEALEFYNEYFNDAGPENEMNVIRSLGNPARVAASIKAALRGESTGEFTENGYQDPYSRKQELIKYGKDGSQAGGPPPYEDSYRRQDSGPKKRDASTIALLIVLCFVGIPVILPIGIAVLAVVLSLAVALIGVFVGVGACAFALIIAGIILFGVGIGKMVIAPFGGLCLLGGGLVCAGIGILFTVLTVWICAKVVPAVIRLVVDLCRIPFRRKRRI